MQSPRPIFSSEGADWALQLCQEVRSRSLITIFAFLLEHTLHIAESFETVCSLFGVVHLLHCFSLCLPCQALSWSLNKGTDCQFEPINKLKFSTWYYYWHPLPLFKQIHRSSLPFTHWQKLVEQSFVIFSKCPRFPSIVFGPTGTDTFGTILPRMPPWRHLSATPYQELFAAVSLPPRTHSYTHHYVLLPFCLP